jgi:hypothetical protein
LARAAAACLPNRDVLVSVLRQWGKSSLALALIV